MNKLKFKSNLTCQGCISKVKPHLEKLNISDWNVNLSDKESLVTVKGDVKQQEVIDAFAAAGYEAKPKKGFLSGII